MATEYETREWAYLRLSVLEEVNGVCQHCKKRKAVTAHHLTYEEGVICPKEELLAVCRLCHGWKHKWIDHDPKDLPLNISEKLQLKLNDMPGQPGRCFLKDAREAVYAYEAWWSAPS